MSQIIDGFGVWESRGNVRPTFSWQSFPLPCVTPNSIFRIVYFPALGVGLNAQQPWGYIRGEYFTGTQIIYGSDWKRIIPKNEPEIFSYPYPPDMMTDPLAPRNLQIKLGDSRYARRLAVDRQWSCQLYEKINSNVIYPTSPATVGEGSGASSSTP